MRANERSATLEQLDVLVTTQEGNFAKARELALKASSEKDHCVLGKIASCLISSDATLPPETIALAHTLALKANEAAPDSACKVTHLAQLAHTTFLRGELAQALQLLEEAKARTKDPASLKELEKTAGAFQRGERP